MALPAPVAWDAPWWCRHRLQGQALWARWAARGSLVAALAEQRSPRFVPQAALPPGTPYESHIAATDCVPTREGLHDAFNALVWQVDAPLKRRLNALQAEAIARDGVQPVRGRLRDALTRFDEFGACLSGPPELLEALRLRQWSRLFIDLRDAWAQARVEIIGHALLEQLATAPRKSLTAHVLLATPQQVVAWPASQWLAKPLFCPLPVLGIPGWWPGQGAAFYADAGVFRPSAWDNPRREAGQTAAGASVETRHGRKVRTAQGSAAANGRPPQGEDQSNRDESNAPQGAFG